MPITQEKFRTALIFLLKDRKISQAKLSKEIKVSKQHINNILRGRRIGTDEIREKIARFFGLSVEEMLQLGAKILQEKENVGLFLEEIILLPRDKRFDKIVEIAKEQTGCPLTVFDSSVRERYKKGEISEKELYEDIKRQMEAIKDAIKKR